MPPDGGTDSIYDYPRFFHLAFGYRNISREVDFVVQAFEAFGTGSLRSILDVACRTGAHAIELARLGHELTGVDAHAAMVEYARARAREARAKARFVLGELEDFEVEGHFQCAIALGQAIAELVTNEQYLAHFELVARCLDPGGIYVVELAHPRPWFIDPPKSRRERWDAGSWAETRGGARVRLTQYRDPVDITTETVRTEILLDLTARGVSRRIHELRVQRLLLPPTLSLLAWAGGGLETAAYFGDFSLDQTLDATARARRIVAVFTKPAPEEDEEAFSEDVEEKPLELVAE